MLTGSLITVPRHAVLDTVTTDWQQTDGIGSLIAVILALAFIIILIVLLIRFLASRNQFWSRTGTIRHLGGVGIGQHKSVQLVLIGGKLYVIGVGNDVRLLDMIEDEAQIRDIVQSMEPAGAFPGGKWFSYVKSKLTQGQSRRSAAEWQEGAEDISFQELLQNRIHDLGNRSGKLKDQFADEEKADGNRQ